MCLLIGFTITVQGAVSQSPTDNVVTPTNLTTATDGYWATVAAKRTS